MNPRIFVVAAVAVMAAIIAGILATGPAMMISDVGISSPTDLMTGLDPASQQDRLSDDDPARTQFVPLAISLGDINLEKISGRSATIEVSFVLENPNERSMIVQTLDYRLFETEYYGNEAAIGGGQIGSRPEGMVEFGSNYYTLLSGGSITLRDTVVIPNSGDSDFWSALESGAVSWYVTGDVFYNLSSMTSGQENELSFEFTR